MNIQSFSISPPHCHKHQRLLRHWSWFHGSHHELHIQTGKERVPPCRQVQDGRLEEHGKLEEHDTDPFPGQLPKMAKLTTQTEREFISKHVCFITFFTFIKLALVTCMVVWWQFTTGEHFHLKHIFIAECCASPAAADDAETLLCIHGWTPMIIYRMAKFYSAESN